MNLVRDKMPEIAQANSCPMTTRKAGPEEMLRLLKAKLVEEATEFAATADGSDQELEELGDVYAVLDRLSCFTNTVRLVQLARIKDEAKGVINDLVWLEEADTHYKAV
jgi:predicted house-cleaning noncanonical NTP pyrophosphatase (MazG superfamily)